MEYTSKVKAFLIILSIAVNVPIVAIWVYFYQFYQNLLGPDTDVQDCSGITVPCEVKQNQSWEKYLENIS